MECGLPRKIGMQPLYFVGFRRCPLVISAPNGDENNSDPVLIIGTDRLFGNFCSEWR